MKQNRFGGMSRLRGRFSLPPLSGQPRLGRLRWVLLLCIAVLLAVLQTSFFPHFDGFPFFAASPDLSLALLVSLAFFAGGRAGGILGICSGVLLDALSGAVLPFSAVFYFLIGYLVGQMNLSLPVRDLRAYAVPAALSLLCRALLTLIRSGIAAGAVPSIGAVLGRSVLPELLWTAVALLSAYPIARRALGGLLRRRVDG